MCSTGDWRWDRPNYTCLPSNLYIVAVLSNNARGLYGGNLFGLCQMMPRYRSPECHEHDRHSQDTSSTGLHRASNLENTVADCVWLEAGFLSGLISIQFCFPCQTCGCAKRLQAFLGISSCSSKTTNNHTRNGRVNIFEPQRGANCWYNRLYTQLS